MFTEIGIENFKAFGKMQRIPLKPITLLYGPNSSGKSSLMQALLLFKQTLEESNDDKIVLLPKGNLVDLGGYQEFINGHDSKKDFRLSISFRYAWQEMEWSDWLWEKGMCADPVLDFSFFQDKTGDTLLKSISISENLHPEKLMTWKNVWSIPNLRRVVMKRKTQFEKDGNAKADIDEWLFNLKRSVLFMDHINPAHYLIKHYWDEHQASISYRMRTGEKFQERYADPSDKLRIQTEKELNELLGRIKEKSEKIKIESNKLDANYSKLKAEDFEERKEDLAVQQAKLEQLKHIWRISKKIHQSLINSSFEDFLKIKNFPASNRLISISNCFPHNEMKLYGNEDMLFQDIPDFALLGKEEINTCQVYDDIKYAVNLLPFASSLLKEYLRRIVYIGPLREYPERVYSYSGNIPSNVGKSGKYTPDILMKRTDLVDKVNDLFERFKIGYKLDVDPLKRNLFALTLTDLKTRCEVSPKDVGFGIGQILPILVQGALSENKIIFIEQPEIHVHPRLQAELGSFLADMAGRARTAPEEYPCDLLEEKYGNQFIIETHSEHLILRLLRLIRDTTNGELKEGEKPLRPEDVAVIYAKPTEHGTELMELRISEDGDFIDKWPDGFFTEREKELF